MAVPPLATVVLGDEAIVECPPPLAQEHPLPANAGVATNPNDATATAIKSFFIITTRLEIETLDAGSRTMLDPERICNKLEQLTNFRRSASGRFSMLNKHQPQTRRVSTKRAAQLSVEVGDRRKVDGTPQQRQCAQRWRKKVWIKLESARGEFAASKLLGCSHWNLLEYDPSGDRRLETTSHAQDSRGRRWTDRPRWCGWQAPDRVWELTHCRSNNLHHSFRRTFRNNSTVVRRRRSLQLSCRGDK